MSADFNQTAFVKAVASCANSQERRRNLRQAIIEACKVGDVDVLRFYLELAAEVDRITRWVATYSVSRRFFTLVAVGGDLAITRQDWATIASYLHDFVKSPPGLAGDFSANECGEKTCAILGSIPEVSEDIDRLLLHLFREGIPARPCFCAIQFSCGNRNRKAYIRRTMDK